MTTYIAFNPPSTNAMQFSTSLDFQIVNCYVPWSLFGKRWYLTIVNPGGAVVVYRALVGSPDGTPIKSITWANGIVNIETQAPHMYDFLATLDLTISGCSPDILNGIQSCFVTGPTSFLYKQMLDPGPITAFGRVDYNINLVANYYTTSTMVYRTSTQNFEITP